MQPKMWISHAEFQIPCYLDISNPPQTGHATHMSSASLYYRSSIAAAAIAASSTSAIDEDRVVTARLCISSKGLPPPVTLAPCAVVCALDVVELDLVCDGALSCVVGAVVTTATLVSDVGSSCPSPILV